MDRVKLGESVIGFVVAASAIVLTLVDWNESYLVNPAWHGHAKFHDALMLCLLAGISIVGLWQLWRDSKEPDIAIKIAALIPVTFWTPFYYISYAVPGTSLLASVLLDISNERATADRLRPPSATCLTADSRNSAVEIRSVPAFMQAPQSQTNRLRGVRFSGASSAR